MHCALAGSGWDLGHFIHVRKLQDGVFSRSRSNVIERLAIRCYGNTRKHATDWSSEPDGVIGSALLFHMEHIDTGCSMTCTCSKGAESTLTVHTRVSGTNEKPCRVFRCKAVLLQANGRISEKDSACPSQASLAICKILLNFSPDQQTLIKVKSLTLPMAILRLVLRKKYEGSAAHSFAFHFKRMYYPIWIFKYPQQALLQLQVYSILRRKLYVESLRHACRADIKYNSS